MREGRGRETNGKRMTDKDGPLNDSEGEKRKGVINGELWRTGIGRDTGTRVRRKDKYEFRWTRKLDRK